MSEQESSQGLPVLFRFSSPFHLLGALSFIDWLRSNGRNCRGIACHRGYWRGRNIDGWYLQNLHAFGVELHDAVDYMQARSRHIAGSEPFIELRINHGFQFPWSTRSVAVIDDGTGAYLSGYLQQLMVFMRERHHSGRTIRRSAWDFGGYLATRALEAMFPPGYPFGLLERRVVSGERAINIHVRDAMLRVLGKMHRLRGPGSAVVPGNEEFVLFVSQPLVRLGLLDEVRYRRLVAGISAWSRSRLGVPIVVSRHPADDFDYRPEPVSEFPGMTEELIYMLGDRVKAVVSMGSTVNFTAKALFGVNTYFCPAASASSSRLLKRQVGFFSQFSEFLDPTDVV